MVTLTLSPTSRTLYFESILKIAPSEFSSLRLTCTFIIYNVKKLLLHKDIHSSQGESKQIKKP